MGDAEIDIGKVAEALGAEAPVRLPDADYSGALGALALLEEVKRLRGGDDAKP